jgi:hypothetical protein
MAVQSECNVISCHMCLQTEHSIAYLNHCSMIEVKWKLSV